jgi:hypothetical protein
MAEYYQNIEAMYNAFNAEIADLEETITVSSTIKSSRYQPFNTPDWVANT